MWRNFLEIDRKMLGKRLKRYLSWIQRLYRSWRKYKENWNIDSWLTNVQYTAYQKINRLKIRLTERALRDRFFDQTVAEQGEWAIRSFIHENGLQLW